MKVIDPSSATNVDLRDVRLIKKLGLVILMLGFPLWLTDGDLVWIWLQGNGGGHWACGGPGPGAESLPYCWRCAPSREGQDWSYSILHISSQDWCEMSKISLRKSPVVWCFLLISGRWRTRWLSQTTPRWIASSGRRDSTFWTFVKRSRKRDVMSFSFRSLFSGALSLSPPPPSLPSPSLSLSL